MKIDVQILGTATGDTTPSVLISGEHARYIINVGEGLQRFCVEHKVKIARVSTLLVTRLHQECIGGLPGMLLTMADSGCKAVSIVGPHGTPDYMHATRWFMRRPDLKLSVHECDARRCRPIKGKELVITPIVMRCERQKPFAAAATTTTTSSSTTTTSTGSTLTPAASSSAQPPPPPPPPPAAAQVGAAATSYPPKKRGRMNAAGQATTVHSTGDKGAASLEHKLPLKKRGKGSGTERQHRLQNKQPKSFPRCTFSSQTEQAFASPSAVERHALTVCYLCETAPVKGKFYPQRALALGVPKGPLFGKLSSGNTVTLEDGTTVRPEDVMDASIPGRAVLVIACPSLDMVPTVTQHAALAPFAKPGIDSERLQCVIHMTPQHVIEDSRYTAWMRAFVQPVTHIVANKTVCSPTPVFRSQALQQCKFHAIDSRLFPLPFPLSARPAKVATGAVDDDDDDGDDDGGVRFQRPSMIKGTSTGRIRVGDAFQAALPTLRTSTNGRPRAAGRGSATASASASAAGAGAGAGAGATTEGAARRRKPQLPPGAIAAETLLQYHLLPLHSAGLDRTMIPAALDVAAAMAEVRAIEGMQALIDKAKAQRVSGHMTPAAAEEAATAAASKAAATVAAFDSDCGSSDDDDDGPAAAAGSQAAAAEASPKALSQESSVVFLGTSSAVPHKYRNVSGILLQVDEVTRVLLDVGEGSYGQLVRRFEGREGGVQSVVHILDSIGAVWISHMHADHHLGLASIILRRKETTPLLVVGPWPLRPWLQELAALVPALRGRFVFEDAAWYASKAPGTAVQKKASPTGAGAGAGAATGAGAGAGAAAGAADLNFASTSGGDNNTNAAATTQLKAKATAAAAPTLAPAPRRFPITRTIAEHLGYAARLETVEVEHCYKAYGVKLSLPNGSTVVYSGDTRPCKRLVALGKNCSLLIHEATFEDGMEEDAASKAHSTVGQALAVGRDMNAGFVLLTHFSARYPRLPVLSPESRVGCAFDLMTIASEELPTISRVMAPLQALFKSDDDDDDAEKDGGGTNAAAGAVRAPKKRGHERNKSKAKAKAKK